MKSTKPAKGDNKNVINAAALQDHYLRQLNLNLKPLGNPVRLPPRQSGPALTLNLRSRETLQQSAQQILASQYSFASSDSRPSSDYRDSGS